LSDEFRAAVRTICTAHAVLDGRRDIIERRSAGALRAAWMGVRGNHRGLTSRPGGSLSAFAALAVDVFRSCA